MLPFDYRTQIGVKRHAALSNATQAFLDVVEERLARAPMTIHRSRNGITATHNWKAQFFHMALPRNFTTVRRMEVDVAEAPGRRLEVTVYCKMSVAPVKLYLSFATLLLLIDLFKPGHPDLGFGILGVTLTTIYLLVVGFLLFYWPTTRHIRKMLEKAATAARKAP